MAAQKSLFREVNSNLLCHSNVGSEHELFHQVVCLIAIPRSTIDGHAILIELECQLELFSADGAALETSLTQLSCKIIEDLDVVLNVGSVMLGSDSNTAKRLAIDDVLRILVREPCSRPGQNLVKHSSTSDKETYLMIVLPNHFLTTLASLVIVKTTEKARRS